MAFPHNLKKTSVLFRHLILLENTSEENQQAAHIDFVEILKDKPRQCYLTLTPTVFVCLRSQNVGLMADALKRIRETNVVGI